MKNIGFLLLMVLIACKQKTSSNSEVDYRTDKHSLSQPQHAIVKHLDLDLQVNFDTEILTGKAVWIIENVSKGEEIILDTRDLTIDKVAIGEDDRAASFTLEKEQKFLGQALKIKIEPGTTKVSIWYKTSKNAGALQWLGPQQTVGKTHPFLYTQSQAILARTWIPCQDSPGIRFTYNARVTVPKELLALMSAQNPRKSLKQEFIILNKHMPSRLI